MDRGAAQECVEREVVQHAAGGAYGGKARVDRCSTPTDSPIQEAERLDIRHLAVADVLAGGVPGEGRLRVNVSEEVHTSHTVRGQHKKHADGHLPYTVYRRPPRCPPKSSEPSTL